MKQLERKSHFAQVATTTISLAIITACIPSGGESENATENPETRPAFLVPNRYQPDEGRKTKEGTIVEASEFAVLISEQELESNIDGFEAQHYGVSQDTMTIVKVYVPALHDQWRPSKQNIKNWDSLWQMTDGYELACMGDKKDELTGLYRYYVYCDGDSGSRSHFFLMDRIPDKSKPRPRTQDYIKGTCLIRKNGVRPDLGPYHQCQFLRKTKYGDQFSFRLQGNNVRLLANVENYIRLQIEGWRQPDNM
jgi:hypothetical protein